RRARGHREPDPRPRPVGGAHRRRLPVRGGAHALLADPRPGAGPRPRLRSEQWPRCRYPWPVTDLADATPAPDDLPEQLRVRREKRDRLLATGQEPYPVGVPLTHSIAELRERFADLAVGEETDVVVGVAGRVVFQRNTGKLCFLTLQDGVGNRLQVMVS